MGRNRRILTAASDTAPADIVLEYVNANRGAFGLDIDDIASLKLSESYTSIDGVTHVTFAQKVDGIESFDKVLAWKRDQERASDQRPAARRSGISRCPPQTRRSAPMRLCSQPATTSAAMTRCPPSRTVRPAPAETTYVTYAESAKLTVFAEADRNWLAGGAGLDADDILYRVVVDAASGKVPSGSR